MNLTKEKLQLLSKKYYGKNGEISQRYIELSNIVNKFLTLEIDTKYIKEFAPLTDGLLGQNGQGNKQNMISKGISYIDDMWKLIGGFDGNKIQAKYRIISSSRGRKENSYENQDYSTAGQSLWANSNFVTNNYPHQIAKFLQYSKKNKSFDECIKESKIVLTWQTDSYLDKGDDNYFTSSNEKLQHRFPPKFLWMWANKDRVIHPISLMAFRNFLNTTYGQEVLKSVNKDYTTESITRMEFDRFKDAWKNISDNIIKEIEIDNEKDNISELSKLISLICIEETDIKNISDLLETGNKAVILWGPPGTGKTYESMQVVKELLEVDNSLSDKNIEDKYLFSKGDKNRNDKGYFEIIQFHPNYTYQDFIGGISPRLDESTKDVSYELKEGIFKKFCDEANREENKNKKFIFIIDEINRAELSAVFGELLFALEYRGKSIDIPYFGNFTIPENVYIIGTMNNVDKSLVTFDLALRRRFGFFKLMPKLEVIKDVLSAVVETKEEEKEDSLNKYFNKCTVLNENIIDKLSLGTDYQIGQAYFLKIKDFLDQEKIKDNKPQIITDFELEKLWVYNIEPLLEEYLGMSIEDENILKKLNLLKKEFLEDN